MFLTKVGFLDTSCQKYQSSNSLCFEIPSLTCEFCQLYSYIVEYDLSLKCFENCVQTSRSHDTSLHMNQFVLPSLFKMTVNIGNRVRIRRVSILHLPSTLRNLESGQISKIEVSSLIGLNYLFLINILID